MRDPSWYGVKQNLAVLDSIINEELREFYYFVFHFVVIPLL